MQVNPRAERFFLIVTLVMIAFIIAGFGSAALFLEEFPYPPRPFLIFHGVLTLCWYLLTAFQARLIGHSRFAAHKQLGATSVILAALMVGTGYFVIQGAINNPANSIEGFSPAGSTIFPTLDLLSFILFYALALANRTKGDAHKRLMVLAGVMMLAPATARLGLSIGFAPLPGVAMIGFLAAFLIYDWRTRGRPHWASVLGLVVGLANMPARFILGQSEAWERLARAIY